MYRPKEPFSTPAQLLSPEWEIVKGVRKKTYPEEGELLFCSFKTYGGTDREVNNVLAVEDTASVETWYRPDIKSDCALLLENGAVYEILGEPENIEMRNQFMKFKVKRVKGNG